MRSTFAAEEAGCQVEIGVAGAMAAAAVVLPAFIAVPATTITGGIFLWIFSDLRFKAEMAYLLVILMVLVAVSTLELAIRMVGSLVDGARTYSLGDALLAERRGDIDGRLDVFGAGEAMREQGIGPRQARIRQVQRAREIESRRRCKAHVLSHSAR